MKERRQKLLVLMAALFVCSATAQGAAPREELKQLVVQLQAKPGDTALREKIIKLARTMKPAPAVPAEAERFDGRGEYAFKSAKNEADFLTAANEFTKASNAAPWVASFYFNAATAFEKGQKPAEAKRNFELYLLAAPSAKDARDVRRRIAGLEFAIEKASSPTMDVRNTIEGTWETTSRGIKQKLRIARQGSNWAVNGVTNFQGRFDTRGDSDRSTHLFYFPNPQIREDYLLNLSEDGQMLSGKFVVLQLPGLDLIQNWTPVSFRRVP